MKFNISCFELSQQHPQNLLIIMHKMEESNILFFFLLKVQKNEFFLETFLPQGVKGLCYMTKQ